MATKVQNDGRVKARQEAAAKLRQRRDREEGLVADAIMAVRAHNVAQGALNDALAHANETMAALVDLGLSNAEVAELLGVSDAVVKAARRPKGDAKRASRETDLVAGAGKAGGGNGSAAAE